MELFFIFHPSGRFYDFPSFWNFFLYIPYYWKILWFSILLEDFKYSIHLIDLFLFSLSGRFYHFPSFWKILIFSTLIEDFIIFHPSERLLMFHPSGIFYDFPSFWNTQFNFDTHWMDGQTYCWILIETEVEITCLFICSFLNRKWNYWCNTC